MTLKEFKSMLQKARQSKDYNDIQEFYSRTFKSPFNLNCTFKKDPYQLDASFESPDLKSDLLYAVLDAIRSLSVSTQKSVIRAVVTCLLDTNSEQISPKDHPRMLYILLQNPLFTSQPTYTILAHLLQQVDNFVFKFSETLSNCSLDNPAAKC